MNKQVRKNMEAEVDKSSATDTIPQIIPCCYGKEVGIDPEIIRTGLSAISIKRDPKNPNKRNPKTKSNQQGRIESRNAFFNLHRPEMTKINWVSTSPRKIEHFFHDHATEHGHFCDYLHTEKEPVDDDLQCILKPNEYTYNEEEFAGVSNSIGNSVLLRSVSRQLSDEDLHPSNICHRSRAEFCVTIGSQDSSAIKVGMDNADPSEASPKPDPKAEHKDSLPPLTRGRVPRVQKTGTRASPRPSSISSLQHLSTIGQSMEIVTISETSEISNALPEDNDGDDIVDDNISFRLILPPQENEYRDSLPNKMTEADELKIRSLQTKQSGLPRGPGGGNYEKKKPPVAADSTQKRTRT